MMDVYNLINSKAVGEYCRKTNHQFNTKEITVLIYRNRSISIYDKIQLYIELIKNYDDMEIVETYNCSHYDSVKDLIKQEMIRLQALDEELQRSENDAIYTYIPYFISVSEYRHSDFDNIYRTYREVLNAVTDEIKEDEDISKFRIEKKLLNSDTHKIIAEYTVENGIAKLVDIHSSNTWLDLDGIFITIPTPFKKGDLLVRDGEVFVLDWLITWKDDLPKVMEKGTLDSSDIGGNGYFVDENNNIYLEHVSDYDNFEYFEGELEGMKRILRGISNLIQGKICITEFLDIYEVIKADQKIPFLFT